MTPKCAGRLGTPVENSSDRFFPASVGNRCYPRPPFGKLRLLPPLAARETSRNSVNVRVPQPSCYPFPLFGEHRKRASLFGYLRHYSEPLMKIVAPFPVGFSWSMVSKSRLALIFEGRLMTPRFARHRSAPRQKWQQRLLLIGVAKCSAPCHAELN